ncbi:MAG: DUF2087 domain-containing protein [Caldilineales bacterium]
MINQPKYEASIAKTFAGSTLDYPRKPQDRIVFLGALSVFLLKRESYSEPALNGAIAGWLRSFDAATTLDHVTLRRYLVDAGFLLRDEAGLGYSVDRPALTKQFEEPVLSLDVHEIVRQARAEREARKSAFRVR